MKKKIYSLHETETERKKESNVCVRRKESLLGRPELDEPRLNHNIKFFVIIHSGSVWVESDVVFRLFNIDGPMES